MTHLASSTWSSLYPSSVVHKELLKEADYWSSLKEQCPNPGQGRLLPRKVCNLSTQISCICIYMCTVYSRKFLVELNKNLKNFFGFLIVRFFFTCAKLRLCN